MSFRCHKKTNYINSWVGPKSESVLLCSDYFLIEAIVFISSLYLRNNKHVLFQHVMCLVDGGKVSCQLLWHTMMNLIQHLETRSIGTLSCYPVKLWFICTTPDNWGFPGDLCQNTLRAFLWQLVKCISTYIRNVFQLGGWTCRWSVWCVTHFTRPG